MLFGSGVEVIRLLALLLLPGESKRLWHACTLFLLVIVFLTGLGVGYFWARRWPSSKSCFPVILLELLGATIDSGTCNIIKKVI